MEAVTQSGMPVTVHIDKRLYRGYTIRSVDSLARVRCLVAVEMASRGWNAVEIGALLKRGRDSVSDDIVQAMEFARRQPNNGCRASRPQRWHRRTRSKADLIRCLPPIIAGLRSRGFTVNDISLIFRVTPRTVRRWISANDA